MNRRTLLLGAPALLRGADAPPNIVLIMADDMGFGDLSSYGCPDTRTPHIDSVGRSGVRFTRCYANAPECTPTRTALLTGRYQQRVGGLECAIGVGNVGRYDEAEWLQKRDELGLPVAETSIARILKTAGYETACSGKWHLGYLDKFSPNRHGFDEYFGILGGNADYFTHSEEGGANVLSHNGKRTKRPGYLTDLIGEHAIGWLRKRTKRPFFLYVPFTAPHTPLQGPDDGPVADAKKWNAGDRATYVRMVERMDQQVGAILSQIERMGAAQNTIVVFKSDNGGYNRSLNGPLRGGKGQLWEGGIRIPCMIRWPNMIVENWTTPQVTLSMDVTATLLAAANVTPPVGRALDGVNMLPILRRDAQPFTRTVFWRYKRLENRRWAVLDGDFKYVRDNKQESLHNLGDDEREQKNLVAAEPDIAERLRAKLTAWERQVQAPRLSGFPG